MRERAALGVLAGEPDRDPLDEQAARTRAPRPGPSRCRPRASASRARSSCFAQLRMHREALGHARAAARSAPRAGRPATAVTTRAAACRRGSCPPVARAAAANDAFRRSCAARSSLCVSLEHRFGLAPRSTTPSSTSRAAYSSRTVGCACDLLRPSAAACTRPRPARCGRSAGSRRGRRRRRGRTRCRYASASRIAADRRLGIVGVDVDDRDVEALREVARVARRAALGGIGREADLVVRDQVQRAAGRVARRGSRG